MINIMDSLVPYINSLNPYSDLVIDYFKGDLEEILIRHEPSQAKVQNYMDGSRIGEMNFSIHAKSTNGKKAVEQLNSFITALDIKDNLELTGLIKVKIEPVTAVRFVTKTEKLEYIYSNNYRLEYEEKRG